MRRAGRGIALLALAFPLAAAAQRPAVSPPLAAAWTRDTVFGVWLFVRPGVSLDSAAALATRAGATVRTRSRWLHAVSVDAATTALRTLARDRALRRIQPRGRFKVRPGPPHPALIALPGDTCAAIGDPVYGPSAMPLDLLNLRPLVNLGYAGTGVRIALLDTGFDTSNPAFATVLVAAKRDFIFNDTIVRNEANDAPGAQGHGTGVWSLLAGDVPTRLRGLAPGATYLLAKTEDIRSETRVEEDFYVAALEWADSIGVDIVSTSLGYLLFDNGFRYQPNQLNGDVAVTTVAVDSAAAQGILVLTAAGNFGPGFRTLSTPADADSGLAIGAEDSLGAIAAFSSRGPTADGRLKPDVTAPGHDVCVLAGTGIVRRGSGTSYATPLAAGAAALVKQAQPTLSGVALGEALRIHARNAATPDSTRGWGRINGAASVVFPSGVTAVTPLAGPTPGPTPLFVWTVPPVPPFAAPVTFRLRIARSANLATPLVDTTFADTSFAPTRAFASGGLFWRVDAVAATGDSATTGTIGAVVIPPWVDLLTLDQPGGVTTLDSQPLLEWKPAPVTTPPGPFTYDVAVIRAGATLPDFGVVGLTDTFVQVTPALERNESYRWRVTARAGTDSNVVWSIGTFLVVDSTVPATTLLHQNFPNPFPAYGQTSTCIWFDVATATLVELEILDLRGQRVRTLVPAPGLGGILPPGRYGRGAPGGPSCDPRFAWDGRSDDGRVVPPGVYLCRLRAGGVVQFKRIVWRGE